MPKERDITRGVAVVALMALSKKEFFQRLLADPEEALAGVKAELELSDDEVAEVVEVIQESTQEITPHEALQIWDGWRATGRWPVIKFWPIYRFWPTLHKHNPST